ncbi:hypothetical protein BYT27DRAFT_7207606 [Phlegmacium glaucopus]|nr:hypothetical protein BYT27DRAFT_7207606 [Phlegmacium glaucopus]
MAVLDMEVVGERGAQAAWGRIENKLRRNYPLREMTQGGVTEMLLSTKGPMEIVKDPASFNSFKEYSKGNGIIATWEVLENVAKPLFRQVFLILVILDVTIPWQKTCTNIHQKSTRPLAHKNDVVIADKNNHLKQHQQPLRDTTPQLPHSVSSLSIKSARQHIHQISRRGHLDVHQLYRRRMQLDEPDDPTRKRRRDLTHGTTVYFPTSRWI